MADVAAALRADTDEQGFRRGENPYDAADALYPWPDPRDGVLTQFAREQGYGLPATGSVDDAVAGGGVELFRGVRPFGDITAQAQVDAMRDDPDFAYGNGIYGNGIYFSEARDVAEAFSVANPDAPKARTADGRVVRVALNPQARIIDLADLRRERDEFLASASDHGLDGYAAGVMFGDEGRFAAARGYDVIRVVGMQDGHWRNTTSKSGRKVKQQSKATQYVVLNRGALTMEAS